MDEGKMIEVKVLLGFGDLLYANYWVSFKNKGVVLLMIMATVTALYSIAVGSFLTVLIALIYPVLLLGSTYLGAKRQMASNRSLQETIHYVFSEQGISATAPSSSGNSDWNIVHQVSETGRSFLIFTSNAVMYIIPKRCFYNEVQLNEFHTIVKKNLGDKAKLR